MSCLHIWHPKLLHRHPMHLPPAQASAAHTILPPAITSGASDAANGWQRDPWFKCHRRGVCCIECDGLAVEIRWVDFDFVQLMQLVQWSLSLLYNTKRVFINGMIQWRPRQRPGEGMNMAKIKHGWFSRINQTNYFQLGFMFSFVRCWIIYKGSGNGLSIMTPNIGDWFTCLNAWWYWYGIFVTTFYWHVMSSFVKMVERWHVSVTWIIRVWLFMKSEFYSWINPCFDARPCKHQIPTFP